MATRVLSRGERRKDRESLSLWPRMDGVRCMDRAERRLDSLLRRTID